MQDRDPDGVRNRQDAYPLASAKFHIMVHFPFSPALANGSTVTRVCKCSSAVLAVLLLGILPAPALHALERQDETHGPPPVQIPEGSDDLGRYLNRLARNPRDAESLVGAGEAALKLGDARAAAEFFARADAVNPNNKRTKTGLARAMLGMENPGEALRLFQAAVRLGARDVEIAADRGLAFDLTGDTASAQRDYKLALDRDPEDPDVLRRYAVSLGIAGKWQEADKVIDPLLRKSDKTAWRNRAFILAMNGQSKQARDITQVMMPKNMADAIQPFMDRMPGLTPAQRAAAVHFGHFPSGIVRSSQPAMVQPLPSAATSQASAQPRGRKTRDEKSPAPARSAPVQTAAATPAPTPRQVQPAVVPAPARAVPPSAPIGQTPAQPAPLPVQTVPMTAPRSPARAENLIGPPVEPNGVLPAAPASVAPPAPRQDTRSLAEIMRGVSIPDTERAPATAVVDLAEVARLQAARRKAEQAAAAKAKAEADARAKAKAEAEAKAQAKAEAALKEKNPARIWVQIATGRDIRALAFDMAKLRKKYPDVLKGKDAWTSPWGATRRMVIGPFSGTSAAKSFYSEWMKAGGDGYIWQSADGLEVEKLSEK